MKNLLYKEWKLNIHPMSIVFAFIGGLMLIVPGNSNFLAFVYVTLSYTFLFLGGTKGVDNNDLYYTAALPIRRVDIVKARTMSIMSLQLINILFCIPFAFLQPLIIKAMVEGGESLESITTMGLEPNLTLFGMALIYFTFMDGMFLPWYYKTTNKIMVPYFVSVFVSMIFFAIIAVVLPGIIPGMSELLGGWNNIPIQFIFLLASVIIYLGGHFLIVKWSQKNFEKVDI